MKEGEWDGFDQHVICMCETIKQLEINKHRIKKKCEENHRTLKSWRLRNN